MRGGSDLASYGSRVGASLLDGLLVGAAVVVLVLIAAALGASENSASSIVILGALGASLLYAPALMCRKGERNGQTLGKQWLGIRVVREDAEPIGVPVALMREFVGKSLLGSILIYPLIDDLWPLWDRRSQALHDKIGGTFVVRADAVPDLTHRAGEPLAPGAPAGWSPPSASAPQGWAAPSAPAAGAWAPPGSAAPPAREPVDMSAWARPPVPREPEEAAPVADRGDEAVREAEAGPEPGAPADDVGFAPPAPLPPPAPEDDEPVRGPFGPS